MIQVQMSITAYGREYKYKYNSIGCGVNGVYNKMHNNYGTSMR